MGYLDNNGVSYLWSKLKNILSNKANLSHTHTANQVTSGTFPSGVSCNTPTANAHLANKAYVDSKAGSVQFKTGSYTNEDSRYNKTIIIDVGFTPDIVILYTEGNNDQYVATEANTTARFNHVPKILTAAFINATDSYGRIKENGFSSYINAGASLYYIAIKF